VSRLECVFEVLDLGLSALGDADLDHIEPARPVLRRLLHQEVLRGPLDPPPLRGRDRRVRLAAVGLRACLDLDEDDGVALGGDQIDLPRNATVVSNDDTVFPPSKMAGGGTLSAVAQRLSGVAVRRPKQPPAQAPQSSSE